MKKIFFILLCFIVVGSNQVCLAQHQQEIDSLLNVLKTTKEDTNKINLMNRLSFLCSTQMRLKYANEALKLALKNKWLKGEAESNMLIGEHYAGQCNYSVALGYYFKALKIMEHHPETKRRIGDLYENIGNVYKAMNDHDKALGYYLMADKFYEEIHVKAPSGNIGDVYYHRKNYPVALKYYTKALLEYNNSCIDLIRIGKVYMMQHEYDKADSVLSWAIRLTRERNERGNEGIGLQLLAKVYLLQVNNHYPIKENPKSHLRKALVLAKESESIFKKASSAYGLMETYPVLIDISIALQDYKAANKYYELFFSAKDKIYNETSSQQLAAFQIKIRN